MKKLLLGGALCAMLSTGAFAADNLTPSCKSNYLFQRNKLLVKSCHDKSTYNHTIDIVNEFYAEWTLKNPKCNINKADPLPKQEYEKMCQEIVSMKACQKKAYSEMQMIQLRRSCITSNFFDQLKKVNECHEKSLDPKLYNGLKNSLKNTANRINRKIYGCFIIE